MESGFGQNLEGFLVKGNLSLAPSAHPLIQGDGSLEGSGTLYFDLIKEYNQNEGVDIQNVKFKNGQLLIPYTFASENLTSASVIIDGGVSIKHTQNSTSITSGGGLTVAGGASIKRDLNVGGIINVNNNSIINVPLPIIGTDAVNKDYVDSVASKLTGNFTTGQVIIADSVGDSIRGYDFFTTDTNSLTLTIPFFLNNTTNATSTSGAFVCYGGLSVSKDVFIGGKLDLNNNVIENLAPPVLGTDAVNKDYLLTYVDSKTYGNILGSFGSTQILIGSTSSNSISSYSDFTYDGQTLNLSGIFNLANTTNSIGLGSGGSLTVYGGASFDKDVYVGGILDVNLQNIKNVQDPVDEYDAINKRYLLDYVDSKTYGNILGSFGSTQILIGSTSSNSISSYSSLTFDGQVLNLNGIFNLSNTTNAIGLGSGGSLTVNGGASFDKNVYIGGVLDVNLQNIKNVQDPVDDYDAVNKHYLEEALSNIYINTGTSFNLNNSVTVPQDISVLTYPATTRAFVTKIFVQVNQTTAALHTIYGYKTDTNWIINSSYVGDETGVNFAIRNNFGEAVMQYTNVNTVGFSTINFSTIKQIDNTASSTQINLSLLPNTVLPVNITELTFLNSVIDSIKLIIYVASESAHKYGLVLVNAILRNGIWTTSVHNIGDVGGVDFKMLSLATAGVVQYTNSNFENDYVIKIARIEILRSQSSLTLLANTTTPIPVGTSQLTYQSNVTNFQLTCVVEVPSENKSALYELNGLLSNAVWKLNSRFIGDWTGVKFSINTVTGIGVLEYTNVNGVNAYLRFIDNAPNTFKPLPVNKGGTGNSYLEPYAVLRGDGSNPILATDDFIYKDKVLILGNESSILLNNTTNAIGLGSGGALNVTGGASFEKDVYIGGQLDVNLQNIKNVLDPIEDYDAVNKRYLDNEIANFDLNVNQGPYEKIFTLNSNVTIPEDIYDFNFAPDVKAFISNVYVETTNNTYSLYTLRGINSGSNWILTTSLIGSPTGVDFYIREDNGSGVIQYTNENRTDIKSIRFITSSLIKDAATGIQINYNLAPNVNVPTDIPSLTFSSSTLDSVKLLIYVSSATDDKYSLYLINCLFNGTSWSLSTNTIGDMTNIRFFIKTDGANGIITYTNPNASNDYTIRATYINIERSRQPLTLNANTSTPVPLIIPDVHLAISYYYFQISIFVNVPTLNKSALFEIQGVVVNNKWDINSRYIGDYTGIHFYISTVNEIGYLSYTNNNNADAIIKVIKDIPLLSLRPLSVSRGGTSSTYLNPYTILRGNGVDPIIGTTDLMYKNNELVIGGASTIVIQNTRSSINLTTGSTFIAYGGVSINKELFIGEKLVVNDVDITPNEGDISAERSFNADNNQISPVNITGFAFDNQIKSFTGTVCVTTTTNTDELDALYEVKGLKKRTGWIIDASRIGDNVGVEFYITNSGQIQYTNINHTDWQSTKMKFRAYTTTL